MKNRPVDRAPSALRQLLHRSWLTGLVTLSLWITLLLVTASGEASAAGGVIFVTTLEQKISDTGGCSLQEAIFSANFDNNVAISRYQTSGSHDPIFVTTKCVAGSGDDVIVLPTNGLFTLSEIVDDAINPFGPTATPVITSTITIEAHGATFQRGGEKIFRAFAIGSTGRLTLKSARIVGFAAKGGDGGIGGGGGGLGAGGAIYVHAGELVVEGSTFEGNGAVGGNGATGKHPDAPCCVGGGGGGGLGGNGGGVELSCHGGDPSVNGGGGGGSRGNGERGTPCLNGGSGGGTVSSGISGGFDCGGRGGSSGVTVPTFGDDGDDAECPGGGGGGGQEGLVTTGNGGRGGYGGGGGGGADHGGTGGSGGFGGGGGAGWQGVFVGATGGNGGFGAGGGAADQATSCCGSGHPGQGGRFGGDANPINGGGGAALGGAIFNDSGIVVVRNSTFTANFVSRGNGGNAPNSGQGANGADAGGAIFTVNGHLTVQHSTVSGNEATGAGGGIVVAQDGAAPVFTLQNTIIANNGANACSVQGVGITASFAGNLIQDNGNCGDPVSADDPQLGPLQDNQGPTPTMAISTNSPAVDAADGTLGLPTDQRGQDRPIGDGYDIGAFELCLRGPLQEPCLILGGIGTVETRKLTISVSPTDTGTTAPAPGIHDERLNNVVLLTATPNTSYRFVNWTGDPVGDSSNASTAIAMDGDHSITANFELFDFNFSSIASLTIPVGGSGSRTVTINSMGAFNAPVTLSVSGQPSGSSPTLNPTPVTPPAGMSVGSQLNVSLGPSVPPGLYTFNVQGTSGPLTHSTPVNLTVVATPESVIQVIGTLEALGCIDSAGVSNAFSVKLARAKAAINAGDTQTAINILTALLNQIQAQAGKHIKSSCTDSNGVLFDPVAVLIANVQSLLTSLGSTAQGNPVMGYVANASSLELCDAVVSLLDSSRRVVATAKSDATGFYFFAETRLLKARANYTVKVTALPKPYKKSTPASQTFTWGGTAITLPRFVLN
jgi:hypothetical protein